MSSVYTDYFQKSRVFLYPLLELKKGLAYVPKQTYIALEYVHSFEDCRLLCRYQVKMCNSFEVFINKYLKSHSKFDEYIDLGNNNHLFVFDFSNLKSDFDKFIDGKYSKFTLESKIIIMDFFSDTKTSDFIEGFLSPEGYHEEYAEILNVKVEVLEKVFELCTPPDLEKEMLNNNNNNPLISLLEKCNVYLLK